MNYELAKKLKDAGFPIKRCLETGKIVKPDLVFLGGDGSIWFYPTLSELIKACGDKFEKLVRDEGKGWRASWFDDVLEVDGYGVSMDEAVADLWLRLNKKLS